METLDVFNQGQDGYHTCRIPAVIQTASGTIVAFCEGRIGRHDHSENDIIAKRSIDGGYSWSPAFVVASSGKDSLNNPQAVALYGTGGILLMYQRYPYGYHEQNIKHWYKPEGLKSVVAGYSGNICSSYLVWSDDDCKTWSKPLDCTRQIKYERATSLASGPGVGIELTHGEYQGRIVMPFNTRIPGEGKFVYAVYSDDHGKSWISGGVAPSTGAGTANEVQVVERSDGSILLNARCSDGRKLRKTSTSYDGGQTWSLLEDAEDLADPQCMGSILRCRGPFDGNVIAFSNPASSVTRTLGTLRISRDDGASWPTSKSIETGHFAYSCLVNLPNGDIGCLYETGAIDPYEKISLSIFSLDEMDSHGE